MMPVSWVIILALSSVPAEAPPTDAASSSPFHAETREVVRDVLAGREFEDLRRDRQPPWWARWLITAVRSVRDFFQGLPAWALWTIFIWMLLALLAIVAHLIYVLLQSAGAVGGPRDARRRAHEGELLGIRELDFESVHERAQQLIAAGEWAAAVRYLYVAAILWLDRNGQIVFRVSKTNRDYQRELSRHPRAGEPFGSLTALFDRAVYRGDQADARLCGQMQALLERIQHEDGAATTR